ncbi:hypothetical protein DPMN_012377 [Dreissena polymorpha]|uniref:Uncharacterized protein n=1 Tax=Dreissena polymorpha TaxID=45954 RepID=A0A9D4S0V4_DREPO|nr:hypothetical protein DPMN_012377 [Dreissena polymorpha]
MKKKLLQDPEKCDRLTDRQTHRQTDRQTDTQSENHKSPAVKPVGDNYLTPLLDLP